MQGYMSEDTKDHISHDSVIIEIKANPFIKKFRIDRVIVHILEVLTFNTCKQCGGQMWAIAVFITSLYC